MWVTFLTRKHLLEDHRGNGTAPWESHTEGGPKEVKTSAVKRLKIPKVFRNKLSWDSKRWNSRLKLPKKGDNQERKRTKFPLNRDCKSPRNYKRIKDCYQKANPTRISTKMTWNIWRKPEPIRKRRPTREEKSRETENAFLPKIFSRGRHEKKTLCIKTNIYKPMSLFWVTKFSLIWKDKGALTRSRYWKIQYKDSERNLKRL